MLATVLLSSILIDQMNEKEKEKKMAYRTNKPASGGSRYSGVRYAKVRQEKNKKPGARYNKRKAAWSWGKASVSRKRTSAVSKRKRTVRT